MNIKPVFDMFRHERVDGMSVHIKTISFDVILKTVKLSSSNLEMLIRRYSEKKIVFMGHCVLLVASFEFVMKMRIIILNVHFT